MGEEHDGPEHDRLCEELLGYLREHPNAMDTLHGIADWWISRQRLREHVERIARALRTLESRELIERVGSEERPLFKLRRPTDPKTRT